MIPSLGHALFFLKRDEVVLLLLACTYSFYLNDLNCQSDCSTLLCHQVNWSTASYQIFTWNKHLIPATDDPEHPPLLRIIAVCSALSDKCHVSDCRVKTLQSSSCNRLINKCSIINKMFSPLKIRAGFLPSLWSRALCKTWLWRHAETWCCRSKSFSTGTENQTSSDLFPLLSEQTEGSSSLPLFKGMLNSHYL